MVILISINSETPVLKIRLQRTGRKKMPFYRVVVAEHSTAVQGGYVDQIGFYNPLVKPWSFEVDTDKALEWIKKGAKPTNTVARLLKASGAKGMERFIVEMKDRKTKNPKEKEEKPA
ncbi:30S ribosomal protein S16, partial [Candidatus Pacearchaeota archaeon]|nr:30S ribosomal protein S16 [Candidatus Pacearchaeota archaeon]